MDGMINPDQALSMKSRKKHASNMTDVEKWYELFHILFPSDDQESYPSPCKSTDTFSNHVLDCLITM